MLRNQLQPKPRIGCPYRSWACQNWNSWLRKIDLPPKLASLNLKIFPRPKARGLQIFFENSKHRTKGSLTYNQKKHLNPMIITKTKNLANIGYNIIN